MRKGFTLIELLGVIILLGLVGLIVIPSITKLIKDSRQDLYESQVKMIEESGRKWGIQNTEKLSETRITYLTLANLIDSGFIEQDVVKDPRNKKDMNGCILVSYDKSSKKYKYIYEDETCENIQNSGSNFTDYVTSEGVNKPKLADGMTAIKWNTVTEEWDSVLYPETDTSWYDYSNKEWANAQTEDGSYWVWIPRYAYQIASNYHSDIAGTINVKFLIDNTDETFDKTTIDETATYSGSSQTNYIKHPAFTFGTTELTGIWVAKFEMSTPTDHLCYTSDEWSWEKGEACDVDDIAPYSIPNVSSWRYVNIGNMFTVSRNMETNNKYGWGTSGSGIDTHMMKNSEWGVVLYLSKSLYGKNSEIWINPSEDYITGCSASGAVSSSSSGCSYPYDSNNGQQASTTGNIYGIYDMSGGAYEYVMGNYNNLAGNSNLVPSSIDDKYIDIYTTYTNAESIKGDAIYETSSSPNDETSWFGGASRMLNDWQVWFARGGWYEGGSCFGGGAGAFAFSTENGYGMVGSSFRTVLAVNSEL